jgi:hypothetical protein
VAHFLVGPRWVGAAKVSWAAENWGPGLAVVKVAGRTRLRAAMVAKAVPAPSGLK